MSKSPTKRTRVERSPSPDPFDLLYEMDGVKCAAQEESGRITATEGRFGEPDVKRERFEKEDDKNKTIDVDETLHKQQQQSAHDDTRLSLSQKRRKLRTLLDDKDVEFDQLFETTCM